MTTEPISVDHVAANHFSNQEIPDADVKSQSPNVYTVYTDVNDGSGFNGQSREEEKREEEPTPKPTPSFLRDVDHRPIWKAIDSWSPNDISGGEFDEAIAARYPYMSELEEACAEAYDELGHEPFLGLQSYARVMGRAMEVQRERYSHDVPKCWLPIIKNLRKGVNCPAAVSAVTRVLNGQPPLPRPDEDEIDWDDWPDEDAPSSGRIT